MEINAKELQRFLDVVGPLVSVLPSVINAAERVKELDRNVKLLTEQRDAVIKETEDRKVALNEAVERARESIRELEPKRVAALAEHKALIEAMRSEQAAEEAALMKMKDDCASKKAAYAAEAAHAESDLDGRLAKVEAQVYAAKEAAESELTAINDRRAVAQKALDDLRASLAG